jgi:hypothetical protein
MLSKSSMAAASNTTAITSLASDFFSVAFVRDLVVIPAPAKTYQNLTKSPA